MVVTTETARSELGRRLRYWRELAGLTQVQLARRLGYDPTFISRLESGTRWPTAALLSHTDDLLHTGGDLLALWPALAGARRPASCAPILDVPLPVGAAGDALSPTVESRHLPMLGVLCPLHGMTGCAATAPVIAVQPYLAANPTGYPGPVVVHGFAALLTVYIEANLRTTGTAMLGPVERCTHALARLIHATDHATAIVLLNLAAQFALLAGWLRVERGGPGLGMVWMQRAAAWAGAVGSPVAAEVLSVMCTVARMEGDGASALAYANACAATDPRRRWARLQSELCLARAYALLGDAGGYEQHATAALRQLEVPGDERDATEAPWLSGTEGYGFVQSFLAGGLRDLAARTSVRTPAQQAVKCAQNAMAHVPSRMHPSHLMLAVRLADAYALAGDPLAAVATVKPVLTEAVAAEMTLINHELRRLHSRLIRRWGDVPEVRDLTGQLRT